MPTAPTITVSMIGSETGSLAIQSTMKFAPDPPTVALRTKLPVRSVMTAAVDQNHRGDGRLFTNHPWFVCRVGIGLFGGHSVLSLDLSPQRTATQT